MSELITGNTELSRALEANWEAKRQLIEELAKDIHAHPELSFQEHRAASNITSMFAQQGFTVVEGICDLPTAFEASIGTGELVVGICIEYDSLPR